MCRLISSAHAASVSVVQLGERGYTLEPTQRGSLPSSQVITVGSSLYATPVIVLTRFSTWLIQSLYQPLMVALV
jgi:hypothetical protein